MTHMRQDPEKTVGDRYYYNISVDRVDPRIHYTKENIQLVCSIVNTVKWDIPRGYIH